MTGNDNVLKLECEKKDISVYELCIQMLNVLIHFLRKEKDEIPPRIKFPTIDILMSIIVDRGSNRDLSSDCTLVSTCNGSQFNVFESAATCNNAPCTSIFNPELYTVLIKGTTRANYIVKRVI